MTARSSLPHSRGQARRFGLLTLVLVALGPFPVRAGYVDVSTSSRDITYGVGWSDFDLDGHPDLLTVRHHYRPIIYRNHGNGSLNFSGLTQLFAPRDHHGPLLADFDCDGDVDIYITAGADAGTAATMKSLYRNDGNFQFEEVTFEWGLTDSLARGRTRTSRARPESKTPSARSEVSGPTTITMATPIC